MIHEIIDDIFDFEFGGVLEHAIDFLILECFNLIATDPCGAIEMIFGADNEPVLELHANIFSHLFIPFFSNDKALGHACK
jgi:hypothetical protein